MSKNPPPYTDAPPGWTPAQTYQPGMPPAGGPQPSHTVIVTNVPTRPIHTAVGPDPVRVVCPSCRAEVLTTMKHEPTTKTHLMALCLFCFICWPCVCLPYCMDSCQNANHYCPNCNAFIGTYQS